MPELQKSYQIEGSLPPATPTCCTIEPIAKKLWECYFVVDSLIFFSSPRMPVASTTQESFFRGVVLFWEEAGRVSAHLAADHETLRPTWKRFVDNRCCKYCTIKMNIDGSHATPGPRQKSRLPGVLGHFSRLPTVNSLAMHAIVCSNHQKGLDFQ
eukprot:GABV01008929.1.p1 GENE.GABV01008929.1~~GABV01008929.1.p1  ORF type:complete len:155 (+),score=13.07 GABV01008929.1:170-634(+)